MKFDITEPNNLRIRTPLFSEGRTCSVDHKPYLQFSQNDYLGLAHHPSSIAAFQWAIGAYGVGSGASAVISGHHIAHEQLEHVATSFLRSPRALSFSSGYQANQAVLSTAVPLYKTILLDRRIHASISNWFKEKRHPIKRFHHHDLNQLEGLLKTTPGPHLICIEGVDSMLGDIAPIEGYEALMNQYKATLLVDDSHAIGVIGEQGRGVGYQIKNKDNLIITLGCGKGLGAQGGLVLGPPVLLEQMVQTCKNYIYTTSTLPALAHVLAHNIGLIENSDLVSTLRKRIHTYHEVFGEGTQSAIQSLWAGENDVALRRQEQLKSHGIWLHAIRPPTVPHGQAMLRISLSVLHTDSDIKTLYETVQTIEGKS